MSVQSCFQLFCLQNLNLNGLEFDKNVCKYNKVNQKIITKLSYRKLHII